MSRRSSRTLYVGNLPGDIRQREVEDLFYKYGPIVHIDLKVPRNPPGFAFVEFMDARDADDAIRGRDGYDFDGHRLRVELAHGGRGTSSSRDRFSGGRGGPHGRVSRRSDYRVLVTGLPSSASPQDLKDHMCKAGDVCFSQVFREGKETTGIADYTNYDDMRYAIRKLDDTEYRNAFSRGYTRVKEYDSRQSRSRSRTRSRSRSRSRSQSKSPTAIFSRCSISLSKSASLRSGTKRGSLSSIERIRSRSFWAKEDAAKLAKSQSDYHKIDTVTRSKDPMMAPMGGATLDGEQAKAVQLNIKKLDIKLKKAYKLAKNHSASSQSDYQKIDCVTPSKAPMMASKHQIPVAVHFYVNLVFYDEQRLKTNPGDKVLAKRLEYYRRRLDIVVDSYKKKGQLSSDWEYDYETASSFEPINHHQVLKKPEKKTTPNPHIYSVALAVGSKGAWQKFKEFDESIKKPTLLGLPCPMDEEMDKEIFTRLGSDDAFVTIIRDVAVGVYNKSCQMYRNKNSNIKNISNAKVKECKYAKVHPFYLFYMNIEVFEQEKNEVYEINLRCNLDDGATVLDCFCLGGPEPLGNREGAHISLESMYETAKDDSLTDPEVRYDISGMVRRTGGYDFYNPLGWDSLSDYN